MTALATSVSRHHMFFQQTMDDLNSISAEHHMPHVLRRKLRMYFLCTEDTSRRTAWQDLTHRLSPLLKMEVAREVNRPWVRKVPFLLRCSISAQAGMSQAMYIE